jgi:predicted acylesterase/phospholipase RssA
MITHVVFSGGGIKGMAYLGILRYLYIENMIEHIRFASGSSIGALYCLYLALKIPIDVIESDYVDLLVKINESNKLCIDKSNFGKFLQNKGITSVDFMVEPAKKYMNTKYGTGDMTFMELSKRTGVNIYITTTSVNTGKRCIFSLETTPNASVIDAVVASMTVPLLFEPVYIDGEYHIDGVVSFNLPIDVFQDVPKDNVLACLIMPNKAIINHEKNEEFTFLNYVFTCLRIFIINLTYQSLTKYIDSDEKHILKLDNLPYDNAFKFDIGYDYIKVKLCQDDVDNLILKGFIEMTNHMKKRKAIVSD